MLLAAANTLYKILTTPFSYLQLLQQPHPRFAFDQVQKMKKYTGELFWTVCICYMRVKRIGLKLTLS